MISPVCRRRALAAIALAALSLSACRGSGPPERTAGDQPVNPDAQALSGFLDRIDAYVEMHRRLERTVPALSRDSSPEQIDRHQRALAQLMQEARRDARQGDLFTPEAQRVMKRLLARVFGGPDGAALKASIMDENPGIPSLAVNSRYPDTVPVSTIPPQLLASLPRLPEEMEFRFVGSSLILYDTHAHLIADFIPDALPQ